MGEEKRLTQRRKGRKEAPASRGVERGEPDPEERELEPRKTRKDTEKEGKTKTVHATARRRYGRRRLAGVAEDEEGEKTATKNTKNTKGAEGEGGAEVAG